MEPAHLHRVPGVAGRRIGRRDLLVGAASLAVATALGGCGDDSGPTAGDRSTTSGGSPSPSTTANPTSTTTSQATAADLYVPGPGGGWETVGAAAAGWSPEGLDAVESLVGSSSSTTFVLLSGGRILSEQYWGGATADTLQDTASVQKSVVSTLIGIAVGKGLLGIEDPISDHLGDGWSKAAPADEAKVTVRHLMTMTSGLSPDTLRKVAEPDAIWDYNTPAYQKLRRVLEAVTGDSIDEVTRTWILDPIGAGDSATWAPRQDPRAVDPVGDQEWGLRMTARDMARFGLFSQRKGNWAGTQVVDAAWFDAAWAPLAIQADYGFLWWLPGNRKTSGPRVPGDWVAALGAGDQKIYVIPSADLVLVRQGTAAAEASEHGSSFDAELSGALLRARA